MGRELWYCVATSFGYVLGLYLLTPYKDWHYRDTVIHIRERLVASFFTTASIIYVTSLILPNLNDFATRPFAHLIGCNWDVSSSVSAIGSVLIIMTLFYLGTLVTKLSILALQLGYEVKKGGHCVRRKTAWYELATLRQVAVDNFPVRPLSESEWYQIARNLIFAPISEEVVYRGIIVAFLHPVCESDWSVILIAPLFFAPAHVHHALVKFWSGFDPFEIAVETVVQLVYTYIFGCIATLLLLRTGGILAPILAHIICNFVQLPDLGFMTPPRSSGYTVLSALFRLRYVLLVAHAAGLALFGLCVMPLTESLAQQSIFRRS